jgi:hypothetical protein
VIAVDRYYGPALSWAAICHMHLVRDGWTEEPETSRRKAIDLARQALQVGQNDPGILVNAGFVLAYFGEDIGAMIGLVDRALALNPSFAQGWHTNGFLRLLAGQPDLAIEHLETALRLSPRQRVGTSVSLTGIAYFFKRQFDEAAAKLLQAIQDDPGFPPIYRALAACYAHMGQLDEARAIVTKLRAITPCSCRTIWLFATPRTASSTCRVCAWRRARKHESDFAATALEYDLYLATRNVNDVRTSGAQIFDPWNDDAAKFPLSPLPRSLP